SPSPHRIDRGIGPFLNVIDVGEYGCARGLRSKLPHEVRHAQVASHGIGASRAIVGCSGQHRWCGLHRWRASPSCRCMRPALQLTRACRSPIVSGRAGRTYSSGFLRRAKTGSLVHSVCMWFHALRADIMLRPWRTSRMRSMVCCAPRIVTATALIALAATSACEKSPHPTPRSPVAASAPAESVPASADSSPAALPAWDPAAGTVLLVRGDTPSAAWVVFPQYVDSALPDTVRFNLRALRDAHVELQARNGTEDSAQIASLTSTTWVGDECIEWPRATIQRASNGAPPPDWSIAFVRGAV